MFRIKQLKELTSALFARVREHKARPEALEAMAKSLANAREFLEKSRNLTGEDGLFKVRSFRLYYFFRMNFMEMYFFYGQKGSKNYSPGKNDF